MEYSLKNLLRQFCLGTTILGLKYFYLYPDRCSRCFWSIAMVLMISLACLLTQLLYLRFAETPTRISIESQTEPVDNMPFPSITICSPNQITVSFMEHFNKTLVDGNLDINLRRVLPQLLGFYELVEVRSHDLKHLETLLDNNRYTATDVMSQIPQSCEDFLKVCQFQSNIYRNCKGLFYPVLTPNGLCCTFNNIYYFNKKKNVENPDFINRTVRSTHLNMGLRVMADIETHDALDSTLLNAGAILIIFSDSNEFPYRKESILIETNTESTFVLDGSYTYCTDDVKSLPTVNRHCYLQHEKSLKLFRGRYHEYDCEYECYIEAIHKKCGCYVLYTPNVSTKEFCKVTNIECILDMNANATQHDLYDCDCLRDCEYRTYTVNYMSGNLEAFPYTLNNEFSMYKINQSTFKLNFFFTKTMYSVKKQETVMSLTSLFANLGGVFGLFLGCSVISVVEIMFFFYVAIYKRNRLRARRDKIRRRVSPNIFAALRSVCAGP